MDANADEIQQRLRQQQQQQNEQMPIEQWYFDIPPITRWYSTAVVATTFLCQIDVINPFQLYFNMDAIIKSNEYWRLITNFLYFGSFGIDFVFYLFFLVRYCRMLEEGSFRGRSADYLWFIMLTAAILLCIAPWTHLMFLGSPLTFTLTYLWSRRNPDIVVSFLGLLDFKAPYMPFVMLTFSFVLGGKLPLGDLLGICIGHFYYFFEDVYPRLPQSNGVHYLRAPDILKAAFHEQIPQQQGVEVRPHQD
ncbi:hypothetical protein MIR68_007107 [Amoeboaphelidium protococcarum]|nr:hypothetical protein MIR68_007107 [Amoeboaphelidium protococcarum]